MAIAEKAADMILQDAKASKLSVAKKSEQGEPA